jgi:energy-coupling factor transport system permease protein
VKLSLQYIENNALLKVSPLVITGWSVCLTILVLLFTHPFYLLTFLLSTLLTVNAAKVWRKWAEIMKLTLILCLAITLINLLVNNNGSHIVWQAAFKIPVLGYPSLTQEALLFSLGMSFRLLTITSVFAVLMLTVHPDDLVQTFLKIRLPPKSVMVMSLALRFLPVLIDDAERIKMVQQSRGLQLERGSLIQKLKNGKAVLIPLFSNSLDRTIQLAEAMEARAFGSGTNRVFYKPLVLTIHNWLGLILLTLAVVLAVILTCLGLAAYSYFPSFDPLEVSSIEGCFLVLLTIMICPMIPLTLFGKRR